MNIAVCIKQVPGTTKVKIDPQTNTLIRQGIENIINPLDTYAVEEAVRLRERYGGEVTVLSMGPPQADAVLREAISHGADKAVLLCDAAFAGADTLATSYTLARAVAKLGNIDLSICGRQTLDGDTGQVASEMSEVLGLPFISYVSKVEDISNGRLRVQRLVEEGYETLEATLPAVISVVKEINTPRLPSLRGIARSKSTVIPVWTAVDIGAELSLVGLSGSATRVVKIFFPQRETHGEKFSGTLECQVDSLLEKLRTSKSI
jgi:electron transfer flavoprotein beta subunit